MSKTPSSPSIPSSSPSLTDRVEPVAYSRLVRFLHWAMALGFAALWITGVMVINMEGLPYWAEGDRQGVVRDLHKSIGLTLLALLVVRIGARLLTANPRLPTAIPATEQKLAHAGHAAIYVAIALACVTGFAIADLQDYGNAYFGIELPKLFATSESVAGFRVDPWSYVAHAVLAYGTLLLVIGHVAFVVVHRRMHRVELITRMTGAGPHLSRQVLGLGVTATLAVALLVVFWAGRAHLTLGPAETPRDYLGTTPFGPRV